MAKWSSQHNGKFPDPYSKLKLDEEKLKKKKKKKKDKNRDRDSILSQIDPNTNKVKRLEGEKRRRSRYPTKKSWGVSLQSLSFLRGNEVWPLGSRKSSTKNRSGKKLTHFSR